MEVSSNKNEKDFNPIDLSIKIESLEELKVLYTLFNDSVNNVMLRSKPSDYPIKESFKREASVMISKCWKEVYHILEIQ